MWVEERERSKKFTLLYCIDPNRISYQAYSPLFLCMNMDVEQHPHQLRSTGLCKTSDSSYLLHHRPPALTVQHFFNSTRSVRECVRVCNLRQLSLKRFSVIIAQYDGEDPLPH